jgi:conjugal transfer/type IV secretion protein DotA/TraY
MSSTTNPLTPSESDLSVQLLNKLFGAGWQNFSGNASGFLQTVLTIFDSAIFSVLGIIAIYGLIMAIAEASHDGVPLGRRYGKWMPFRIVFAGAFLAPVANGISIIQSVFLWVVGMGIGLADATWDKGTTYLITSGPAVVASQATGSTLAKDALQSLVCQYWVNQNYYFLTLGSQTGLIQPDGTQGPSLPAGSGSFVNMTTTSGAYTVTNPSTSGYGPANFFGTNPGGTTTNLVSQGYSFDGSASSGLPPHICGDFTFSYSDSDPGASSIAAAQSAALKNMLSTLAPLAQAIVGNASAAATTSSTSALAAMPDPSPLYTAINAYQNRVSAAATAAASAGTNAKILNTWQSTAQTGGWLTAGSFYYSFAHQNQRLNAMLQQKWAYTGVAVDSIADPNMSSRYGLKNVLLSVSDYTQTLDQAGDFVGNPPTAAQMATASGAVATGSSGWDKFMSMLSSPAVGIVTTLSNLTLQNGDPLLTIQSFGSDVIDAGELMLASVATMLVAEESVDKIVTGASKIPVVGGVIGAVAGGLTGAAKGLAMLGVPVVLMIVLPIIIFGAGLAYLFPSIPYIYFTFGVVVWVYTIMEGLFAVPIWGIMHAQPEGEGFLPAGVREGYFKVLSVFLRPVYMIIGFFVLFMILEALSSLILQGFSTFVSGITAGSLTGIVGILSMLFVLNIVLLESTRRLFKLTMIDLPSSVMSWIGSSGSSVDHPGGSIDSVKTPSVPRGGGAKASEIVGEAGVVKALTAPPQSKTAEIAGGSGGKGGGPGGGATTDTLSDPATSSAGPGEIDLSTKIDNNHNTK